METAIINGMPSVSYCSTYVSSDDKSEAIVDSSATSAMDTACCSICLRFVGVVGFSGVAGASGGATNFTRCKKVKRSLKMGSPDFIYLKLPLLLASVFRVGCVCGSGERLELEP